MGPAQYRKILVTSLVLIITFALASGSAMPGPNSPGAGQTSRASIGSAKMLNDGTIVLMLRAESKGGMVGDAVFRYPPDHPQYNDILRHLGGLKKGEVKPVPPWPEKE